MLVKRSISELEPPPPRISCLSYSPGGSANVLSLDFFSPLIIPCVT